MFPKTIIIHIYHGFLQPRPKPQTFWIGANLKGLKQKDFQFLLRYFKTPNEYNVLYIPLESSSIFN